MNKNYRLKIRHWSKRFSTLWPLGQTISNEFVPLPRLMNPNHQFPAFVRDCPVTMSVITTLRLLDWTQMSQKSTRKWFGRIPIPPFAYAGAFLVKIDQKITTISQLRRFLMQHPALIWALGFPLYGHSKTRHGFNPEESLPSRQQFSRALRQLDNQTLQRLLTAQVQQLQTLLPDSFGQTISIDTKHIIAWVKENNPRQYVKEGRYDKTKQPTGDPDCKLGCKRAHNRVIVTPAKEGQPASQTKKWVGEYYWGYASGAVVTKVDGWGEFVLAEMTDTFDKGDIRFFFPLMAQVEPRLGFRPRYGTADAAYDAFYVYDYFHSDDHDGFAAVPLNQPNRKSRLFDEQGLPLCDAGLPMPIRKQYNDRTKSIIPHQRAIHACPLLHPQPNNQTCPIEHKQWKKGKGCTVNLPTSLGARLRHQLDRDSDLYKQVYRQRTAVERIFSQAKALGIERPKLRNQQAITNLNTLLYLLVNLRALQVVFDKLESKDG